MFGNCIKLVSDCGLSLWEKAKALGRRVLGAVPEPVARAGRRTVTAIAAVWFLGSGLVARADGTVGDPLTIVTDGNAAFVLVSGLVVTVVGFYIVVKIVRGIKGR